MRQLPTIVRLLICSLLIGGYGAMYAGSVLHDLGHTAAAATHAEKHHDHAEALAAQSEGSHFEVACFFCTHAPVISSDLVLEQCWTASVASLAPPTVYACSLHTVSIPLAELRGPPAV